MKTDEVYILRHVPTGWFHVRDVTLLCRFGAYTAKSASTLVPPEFQTLARQYRTNSIGKLREHTKLPSFVKIPMLNSTAPTEITICPRGGDLQKMKRIAPERTKADPGDWEIVKI